MPRIAYQNDTYSLHEVVGLAALEGDGHPEAALSHMA
jgi:hypothetical protein